MARVSFDTIGSGLDQLYFTPLLKDETIDDRAEAVENYLSANGWTWDEYLAELAKELTTWTSSTSSLS